VPAAVLLTAACGEGDFPTYARCSGPGDCQAESDGCFELHFSRSDGSRGQGRLCSRECSNDAECPGDGACLALDGDSRETFLCYARCEQSEDCYQGFRCTETEGADGVMRVCLP
jgi:hypothetical protein